MIHQGRLLELPFTKQGIGNDLPSAANYMHQLVTKLAKLLAIAISLRNLLCPQVGIRLVNIRIRINCCQLTCSYYTYILLYTSLYTLSFKGGAAIFVCQAFGRSGVATRDGFQLAAMLQHLLVLAVSYGR